jgi:hypothetical protein
MARRFYFRLRSGEQQYAVELRAIRNLMNSHDYELRTAIGLSQLDWEWVLYCDANFDLAATYQRLCEYEGDPSALELFADSSVREDREPAEYGADPDKLRELLAKAVALKVASLSDGQRSLYQVQRLRRLIEEANLRLQSLNITEAQLMEWERRGWAGRGKMFASSIMTTNDHQAFMWTYGLLNALVHGATLEEVGLTRSHLLALHRRMTAYSDDQIRQPEGWDKEERQMRRRTMQDFQATVMPMFAEVLGEV